MRQRAALVVCADVRSAGVRGIVVCSQAIGIAFEFSLNGHAPTADQQAKLIEGNAKYLPRLEAALKANGNGRQFVTANDFTYADVLMLDPLEVIAPYETLAEYPMLKMLHAALRADPKLSAWLESDRRKTKVQHTVEAYRATVRHTLN